MVSEGQADHPRELKAVSKVGTLHISPSWKRSSTSLLRSYWRWQRYQHRKVLKDKERKLLLLALIRKSFFPLKKCLHTRNLYNYWFQQTICCYGCWPSPGGWIFPLQQAYRNAIEIYMFIHRADKAENWCFSYFVFVLFCRWSVKDINLFSIVFMVFLAGTFASDEC